MDTFVKSLMMFLSSNEGLYAIWVLFYSFYLFRKTGKYSYFWFLLLPFFPILHFFTTKKTVKEWILFILLMLINIFFSLTLQPRVIHGKIVEVTVFYNDAELVFLRKNQLKTIIDIKWDVFKRELMENIGIKDDKNKNFGDLKFLLEEGTYYYFSNYPLDKLLIKLPVTTLE